MKIIFSILTFLLLTTNVSIAQENTNETSNDENSKNSLVLVGIEAMACQHGCADTIAANLKNPKGIKTAEVSYQKSNPNSL